MAVVLKFQSTGSIPGNGDPVAMRGPSVTLGRGTENDVVLPDPDRVLSKRHCAIEDHNGNVVVVDISTNGTFLNYGKLPLGATPTPLNDGDILSVGPYEILVTIASGEDAGRIPGPAGEGQVSHGDAGDASSPMDLLDAPGDGGDFLDDLLDGRDGPVGPGAVDRMEPDEDGLLPPLEDEDGLLRPPSDPFAGSGASAGVHSPAPSEVFRTPGIATDATGQIPDDWEDFLRPAPGGGSANDPFGGGGARAAAVAMPPTGFAGTSSGTQHPPGPAAPYRQLIPENTTIAPAFDPLAPPPPAPAPPARPAAAPPAPRPPAAAAPPAGPGAAGRSDAAAQAFLHALGDGELEIRDADLVQTMDRMGRVLRAMIEGMREILMTRTSIKSEFRIERTMIQSGGNNPLKFSISPEQAIEAMVKPRARGYLDAADATRQALDDIKAHEVAMISGMEAALKGVLRKLDPVVLGERIAKERGLGSMLRSRRARYWELYEEMYAEISDQAENDFHQLFAKAFAEAYKAQLDKLK